MSNPLEDLLVGPADLPGLLVQMERGRSIGVKRLLQGDALTRATEMNPLRRLGTIDDIARAAVFLCSDEAAYVNGVTLPVDGGAHLASVKVLG